MAHIYSEGTTSNPSTIDAPSGNAQLNPFYYDRQAIIEANKQAYIGRLSGTRNQPKHAGKEIKKHLIIPLLDDRNLNDQGIDAAGAVITAGQFTAIDASGNIVGRTYATLGAAQTAAGAGGTARANAGNLYGSSKDVATVSALTPVISEVGGRVNRIGFTREVIKSTLENYGFFYEFTEDDLNFDSDPALYSHLYREAGKAAGEMSEKSLIVDLLNGAGIVVYTGGRTSIATVAAGDNITLAELRSMEKTLNANKAPTDTAMITGSRNVDTKVVAKARYAYTTDDMITRLEDLMNPVTGKHAWAYVEEYADGAKFASSNTAMGETGKVGKTRFIEHQEMLIQEGKGAAGIDVHPIMYIGSGSFTQIGFQSNKGAGKFSIIVKKPGKEIADRGNPYGKVGFVSNQYWYGVLIERPDWIGVIYGAV